MRRSFLAVSSVAFLLTAAPAFACEGDQMAEAPQSVEAKKPTNADAAPGNSVLAPVDEVLSATCDCGGPSDCTCKKGECKCKKCSRHQVKPAVKKTLLMEPINGRHRSPVLPQNARFDATAGIMI